MKINDFVQQCHENAKNKGFWDKTRETGTLVALIHSEVTEALDAGTCAEFCEELADICIRIGDLCGGLKIDLEAVLSEIGQDIEAEGCDTSINMGTIEAIEKSLSSLPPDFNDHKHACEIHMNLSYALEADRKNDNEYFSKNIGWVFLYVFMWAKYKGYRIEEEIMAKMEKNKARPRLHGKEY